MNRIKMVSGFIVLSFLMAGCGLNAGGAGIKAAGITGQMSQAAKGILAAQTLENLSQVTGGFLERESDEAREEAAAAVQAAEEARREAEEAERQAAIEAARAADPYWDRPEINPESWEFILANPWNDIGDYTPELASLEGQRFDVRIVDAMRDFAEAARD